MKNFIRILFFLVTIALLTLTTFAATDINENFNFEEFTHEETYLPYRIYIPEDYSEENDYPLVVFLHGAGERGIDNELQLKNAVQTLFDRADGLMLGSIVIAPQCPEGNQWVDTPWEKGNYDSSSIPESNELAAVVALTEEICDKYSVDPMRIYAMGVSMGGFGTWDLLIRHNDIFAAGAPMCGGGDPFKAELLAKTPIYTFHGTDDTTVPYAGTSEMVYYIENEDGRLINFVTYEGDGHGIWEKASAEPDWLAWIFEQKLSDRYPQLIPIETEAETGDATDPESTDVDGFDCAVTDERFEQEKEVNKETEPDESKNGTASITVPIIIGVAIVAVAAVIIVTLIVFEKKK